MTKIKFYLTVLLLFSLLAGCKPKVSGKDSPNNPTSETKLDHLVIWEVFYSGSWREQGYADMKPMYIKIFNPTEEPKYLDGLCLAISRHTTNDFTEVKLDNPDNNFFKTNFAMEEILQFPGTGQEYAIKPGATILIAKMAIDFTKDNPVSEEKGNPLSMDLSKAGFEWYSTSEQFDFEDCEDNTSVPNLKRNFFYSGNADKGLDPTNRTLVLFEAKDKEYFTKIDKEDSEYYKKYSITMHYHHGGSYDLNLTAPIVPNEWIIDAVNISPINDYKMKNISESLDGGWFGVSQRKIPISRMKRENTGLAMRRKWNGKSYEDTNNSSHDFEVVPASLQTAQEAQSGKKQSEAQ